MIFDIRVAYAYSGDDTEFPRVIRRLVVGERACWLLFSRVKIGLPRPRAVLINSGVNDVLLVFRGGERPLKSDGPVINRGTYRRRRLRWPLFLQKCATNPAAVVRPPLASHYRCAPPVDEFADCTFYVSLVFGETILFIYTQYRYAVRVCRHKHMTLAIGQRQLGDRYINRQENRFHRIRLQGVPILQHYSVRGFVMIVKLFEYKKKFNRPIEKKKKNTLSIQNLRREIRNGCLQIRLSPGFISIKSICTVYV